MKFFTENKTTIIAISIIILGIVAYLIFFNNSSDLQNNSGLVSFGDPLTSAANREFLSLFTTLKQINFDTSLLQNADFKNLEDFSREVTTLPTGKKNPFSPL